MKHRFAVLLNAIFIAAFTVWFNASTYPKVGVDYKYFLPRLLDTHLHYKINGLGIQWYTPSFGGGLPAFAHPQNMQFSLAQLLVYLTGLWTGLQINYFLLVLAGFLGAYWFFRRTLRFKWQAGLLGALFFSANGFYLQHAAAGHLNFQGFCLLPFLLIGLLDASLPPFYGVILLSVTFAVLLYSASFYPLVFILLAIIITLPLAYLLRPAIFRWKQMALSAIWGGLLTLGLTGAKLYAIASFMRFFPREVSDVYNVPLRVALEGFGLQFLGVMTLAPIYALAGWKMAGLRNLLQTYTGAYLGLWELDVSLAPLLWPLLLIGLILLGVALKRRGWPQAKSFWMALILLVLAAEIGVEFTLARGIFYPFLQDLPVLRSLHVNPRYASVFIFPLALAGAAVVDWGTRKLVKRSIKRGVFISLNFLALIPLGAYLLLPVETLQRRIFDASGLVEAYAQIQQGETFPVIQVLDDANDAKVFSERATNLSTQEMIFGYQLGQFKSQLRPGPVTDFWDGAYNLTDPTGLVYPEMNGVPAFARISDPAVLDAFANRRQPAAWQVPPAQKALDALAVLTLLFVVGALGWKLGTSLTFKRR